jgi:endonuclease YncB( thermonuclease family)
MTNLYKFLVPLLLVLSFVVDAEEIIEGRVVGVHDGDTVNLLISGNQQLKIRLAQIDAPESDQAFGQRSKQTLSDMVFNKSIQVKKETIDKYGRTVGTIIVDGIDANKEQIKLGMAWVYRQYFHDQSMIQLEEEAQKSKIGLWSDPNPIPPWKYRHGGKKVYAIKQLPPSNELKADANKADSSCGNKRYCKEMTSCEEAKFYLTQCGLSRLDGDGDGVPCEKICRP